jgi:hypothetical protein
MLGEAQLNAGRFADARTSADSVLASAREIVAQRPPGSRDRVDLVEALILAGEASAATRNPARAEVCCSKPAKRQKKSLDPGTHEVESARCYRRSPRDLHHLAFSSP